MIESPVPRYSAAACRNATDAIRPLHCRLQPYSRALDLFFIELRAAAGDAAANACKVGSAGGVALPAFRIRSECGKRWVGRRRRFASVPHTLNGAVNVTFRQ